MFLSLHHYTVELLLDSGADPEDIEEGVMAGAV